MYFKEGRKGMRYILLCRSPWIPICHSHTALLVKGTKIQWLFTLWFVVVLFCVWWFVVFFLHLGPQLKSKWSWCSWERGSSWSLFPRDCAVTFPPGRMGCNLSLLRLPSQGSFTKISLLKRRQKAYLSRYYILTCFLFAVLRTFLGKDGEGKM